ncbi:MAG TPA: peptidylprolyl isomerase [Herpetosiphonaceae bacterium]|nr:peptidylprolyl isomerase [Herpetosiphonaceae bacterium]
MNNASSDASSTTTSPNQASTPSGTGAETGNAPPARKQYSAPPAMVIDPSKHYTATINTTKGTMKAELYANEAPLTVNNFVFLSRDGFYNGIKFHRIVKGFMVQTGDPRGDGTGGPGYEFKDEPVTRDYTRGTLAMANAGPNTNGSQFFIVQKDSPGLQKNYTIFGKLTEGFETLDAIANTPVGPAANGETSAPQEDVHITSITIGEK